MSIDTEKSDLTLKMQLIRMQLEIIAYSRIQLKTADSTLVLRLESFWLRECEKYSIIPYNNFQNEYQQFTKETVLKFAPPETLKNMEEKALLTLEKNGISRDLIV